MSRKREMEEVMAIDDQSARSDLVDKQGQMIESDVDSVMSGLTPAEIMEKLFKMEINDPETLNETQKILKRLGKEMSPLRIIKPTRDFVLGNHDIFDEFEIIGDYEDAIVLSQLDPAFWGTSVILYNMAITRSAITRSRGGFQQKNLRSYYGYKSSDINVIDKTKQGWQVPFIGKR